jgi:hypothetical protein
MDSATPPPRAHEWCVCGEHLVGTPHVCAARPTDPDTETRVYRWGRWVTRVAPGMYLDDAKMAHVDLAEVLVADGRDDTPANRAELEQKLVAMAKGAGYVEIPPPPPPPPHPEGTGLRLLS